jgi:hypothetical protein
VNLAKSGKLDHQAIVACAEAGQAVPSAANGGHEVGSFYGLQAGLNVTDVPAASENGGPAIEHSIPHGRNFAILAIPASQQCSFKISADRFVDFF